MIVSGKWKISVTFIIEKAKSIWESVKEEKLPTCWCIHVPGSYDSSVRAWDCRSRSYDPIQVLGDAKDSVTSVQLAPSEILTGCVCSTHTLQYPLNSVLCVVQRDVRPRNMILSPFVVVAGL